MWPPEPDPWPSFSFLHTRFLVPIQGRAVDAVCWHCLRSPDGLWLAILPGIITRAAPAGAQNWLSLLVGRSNFHLGESSGGAAHGGDKDPHPICARKARSHPFPCLAEQKGFECEQGPAWAGHAGP